MNVPESRGAFVPGLWLAASEAAKDRQVFECVDDTAPHDIVAIGGVPENPDPDRCESRFGLARASTYASLFVFGTPLLLARAA